MSDPDQHATARFLQWLVVFGVVTACAALIGFLAQSPEWYDALLTPPWTPEESVVRTVWAVLYPLIAVAGCLVWTRRKASLANLFWAGQLVANGAWPMLFFGQHRIDAALLVAVILLFLVAGFIWSARKTSRFAAILFLPYFAWVGFAAALNAVIWQLNGMPMGVFDLPGAQ